VESQQRVTDKNRLEFHIDKVRDFGAEVECLSRNSVGEVVSATVIPGISKRNLAQIIKDDLLESNNLQRLKLAK